MMLEYSFKLPELAARVHRAIAAVIDKGYRTADIVSPGKSVTDHHSDGRNHLQGD